MKYLTSLILFSLTLALSAATSPVIIKPSQLPLRTNLTSADDLYIVHWTGPTNNVVSRVNWPVALQSITNSVTVTNIADYVYYHSFAGWPNMVPGTWYGTNGWTTTSGQKSYSYGLSTDRGQVQCAVTNGAFVNYINATTNSGSQQYIYLWSSNNITGANRIGADIEFRTCPSNSPNHLSMPGFSIAIQSANMFPALDLQLYNVIHARFSCVDYAITIGDWSGANTTYGGSWPSSLSTFSIYPVTMSGTNYPRHKIELIRVNDTTLQFIRNGMLVTNIVDSRIGTIWNTSANNLQCFWETGADGPFGFGGTNTVGLTAIIDYYAAIDPLATMANQLPDFWRYLEPAVWNYWYRDMVLNTVNQSIDANGIVTFPANIVARPFSYIAPTNYGPIFRSGFSVRQDNSTNDTIGITTENANLTNRFWCWTGKIGTPTTGENWWGAYLDPLYQNFNITTYTNRLVGVTISPTGDFSASGRIWAGGGLCDRNAINGKASSWVTNYTRTADNLGMVTNRINISDGLIMDWIQTQ